MNGTNSYVEPILAEADGMLALGLEVADLASGAPAVLDVCCGSRKFWFDQDDRRALFIDSRREEREVSDPSKIDGQRRVVIQPDVQADFRNLPFANGSFSLVVFDPPHIKANRTSKDSRMAINYGTLGFGWREDLAAGFRECFRVLKTDGVLVFKWAETNIKLREVLSLTPQRPLFGNRMPRVSGTHWIVFMKGGADVSEGGETPKRSFTSPEDSRQIKADLTAMLACEGVTERDADFARSLIQWRGCLTIKQAVHAGRVLEKYGL